MGNTNLTLEDTPKATAGEAKGASNILTTTKADAKTTPSGNFFANSAIRDGWAGPCGTMWRLTHDPVRHILHARKPLVINTENLTPQKGGAYESPLAEEG